MGKTVVGNGSLIRVLRKTLPSGMVVVLILLSLAMTVGICRAASLMIDGQDQPFNGDQYTATGGCGAYTWSINKGSITSSGMVTVSGQCGKAMVTVRDACGQVATKDVRLNGGPGGQWVMVSESRADCDNQQCAYHWAYDTVDKVSFPIYPDPYRSGYLSCESITGTSRSVTLWGQTVKPGLYWSVYHNHTGATGPNAAVCEPISAWENSFIVSYQNKVFEWRCTTETSCVDTDGDGYYAIAANCPTGNDCNDYDAKIYPNAPEICSDQKDNDCNGQTDESCKRNRCMDVSM